MEEGGEWSEESRGRVMACGPSGSCVVVEEEEEEGRR